MMLTDRPKWSYDPHDADLRAMLEESCKSPFAPTTTTPIKGGTKADFGKPRYDLLPVDSMEAVVSVLTMGAEKYSARNWEKGIAFHRPFAAMMRHAWAWWRGESTDPESGLSHMAHVACNALFLCSYELRGMDKGQFDDRPIV